MKIKILGIATALFIALSLLVGCSRDNLNGNLPSFKVTDWEQVSVVEVYSLNDTATYTDVSVRYKYIYKSQAGVQLYSIEIKNANGIVELFNMQVKIIY